MLTIRSEQMSQFEQARMRDFAESTVAFIRERYPEAWAQFGEAEVRGMVAKAVRKAREHRITSEADMLRYINVMYTLGCDFEDDPQYPWAREIMKHPRLRPGSKIERLVARTRDYLRGMERSS